MKSVLQTSTTRFCDPMQSVGFSVSRLEIFRLLKTFFITLFIIWCQPWKWCDKFIKRPVSQFKAAVKGHLERSNGPARGAIYPSYWYIVWLEVELKSINPTSAFELVKRHHAGTAGVQYYGNDDWFEDYLQRRLVNIPCTSVDIDPSAGLIGDSVTRTTTSLGRRSKTRHFISSVFILEICVWNNRYLIFNLVSSQWCFTPWHLQCAFSLTYTYCITCILTIIYWLKN